MIVPLVLVPHAVAAPDRRCPEQPVQSTASARIPNDVCIAGGFTGVPVNYFDDYSWRTFVAMVRPAVPGRRGMPDSKKNAGGAGPRVFETYKSLWEVFHEDGSAPSAAFGNYDAASANACQATAEFGDLVLASASGIDDIGQAGAGELDAPLAAQNGIYVRYLTLYNQVAFDYIVMYGPPPVCKRNLKMTVWSAPMYSAFSGVCDPWP